ncbi:hypothetical protein [Staphylococcus shinii]|uniref:hypothetical protein n=1 Tax=Staphylococcus shinii TaxID=2912228 RepID=UPI003EEBD23C
MVALRLLVIEMARYYADEKLAHKLKESNHEILHDIGNQALKEDGYPDWVKITDVDFVIEITNKYSFEDWAELAKSIFHIEDIKKFVKEDMYEMFVEFIDLFKIKIRPITDIHELEAEN